jgi:hypothetical protein
MILKLFHVKQFWSDSKTLAREPHRHFRPWQRQPGHAPEWPALQAGPFPQPLLQRQQRQSNRDKFMHA